MNTQHPSFTTDEAPALRMTLPLSGLVEEIELLAL
jgi:hypothetical protein